MLTALVYADCRIFNRVPHKGNNAESITDLKEIPILYASEIISELFSEGNFR